jgi:hypothetical protein
MNEDKADKTTIDIDGSRPVDPSHLRIEDTIDIDGHRPIASSPFQVRDTLDVDGSRPIAASHLQADRALEIDGKRPIDPSSFEIEGLHRLICECDCTRNNCRAGSRSCFNSTSLDKDSLDYLSTAIHLRLTCV